MDNSNPIAASINMLYRKCKKKPKKELEIKDKKKVISIEAATALLSKNKVSRTKQENKLLGIFLSEEFTYFTKLRDAGEIQKLEKIVSVLNLEIFKPGESIISFGEEGDKFYILFNGKVSLYKPTYIQKEMKLREYVSLMEDIKDNEENELKFNRMKEKNAYLKLDLEVLFNLNKNSYHMNQPLTFFIEEDQKLGEFGKGFAFGEIALIKRCQRNATIKSEATSWLLSIDKSDYNKVLRELEEKRLEKQLGDFKRDYPLFEKWTLNQMIRLFNCFSKRTLTQGEYLYKQNEDADTIYIIQKGTFEVYSLVSFGWLNDFFGYIISARNNLVHFLDEQGKQLKDTELREFFDEINKNIEQSPCIYDPLKVAKIITSNDKEDCFVDIKQEEEELNNKFNLFKIKIRTINYKDVIGLIDSLELKKRYTFVKCVSPEAEVLKVSLYDFFRLVNINPEPLSKKILMNIIANKKAIFFNKILSSSKTKIKAISRSFDFKYDKLAETEHSDKTVLLKLRDKDNIELNPLGDSPIKKHIAEHKKYEKTKMLTITSTSPSSNTTSYTNTLQNHPREVRKSKTNYLITENHPINQRLRNKLCKLLITEKNSPIRKKMRNKEKSPSILTSSQSRYSHFYLLSKQISSFDTNENSTSNINCDLISIFCECKCIFYRRNASWATNSSESIHEKEYRQYQHRYDMIIKLGFSSQLFIIFYIFSFGFYFIYLGLNYIISNEVYPWLDPIMIVIIFVLVLGGIGLFIAMSVIKKNKEFWPSTELDKNRKLIVNKLRENKEKEVTKQTEMGIHNVIADMFMLIRPEITEIMMNDGISGEEKIEKVNELFNHYNGYQVVHQAKRREINELFVEEFERRKKERANYIKGNTNKYDYFIPNLSEYLKLSNYRKYQFESKINASLEEENPFVDLSNEVSVIIGTLNPKVRNIPETFIKDVVCNVDLDKQITKKTFSRRRKKNNM